LRVAASGEQMEPDFVSRGFTGRRRGGGDRLPPGQYDEPELIRTERFGPTG
jgi:hypothetical protein